MLGQGTNTLVGLLVTNNFSKYIMRIPIDLLYNKTQYKKIIPISLQCLLLCIHKLCFCLQYTEAYLMNYMVWVQFIIQILMNEV